MWFLVYVYVSFLLHIISTINVVVVVYDDDSRERETGVNSCVTTSAM